MMKKIALLPLDTRPCNIKYPLYISNISGMELVMPHIVALGGLDQEGDIKEITDWLLNSASKADDLILSVDMLAFGGLVSSRTNMASLAEAVRRLDVISQLKKINPRLKISAFSVITRLSMTVKDDKSAGVWADLFRYAMIADRYEVLGEGSDERELIALKRKLSVDVIEEYHRVRARNHEINKAAVEMADTGMVDMLVLCTEDAAQYGLHRKEKIILEKMIKDKGLTDKARVLNGADEIASVLIARAKVIESGKAPKIAVRYLHEEGKQAVSLYEDKPVEQVVADHIDLAGGSLSHSTLDHDIKLFVNTPRGEQVDIFISTAPEDGNISGEMVKEIKQEVVHGKQFSIADIRHCNGSDAGLVEQLLESNEYLNAASYSAFNTTSNTVGVALAHAIAYLLSEKDDAAMRWHREFQLYSLFSDYLYDAVVRPEMITEMREERMSIHGFPGYYDQIVPRTAEKMMEAKQEHLDRWDGFKDVAIANIRFPWKRLFEIDMDISFGV